MYQQVGDSIATVTEVTTPKQVATVGQHFCFAAEIHAVYDAQTSTLRAEYRAPVIDGTEWQGQLLTEEIRPMLLVIDDSAPVEIIVVAGVAEQVLDFEAPGTYLVELAAGFPCQGAELEVIVP